MVASEDVPQFARQIYAESRRMIRLVEDIIKLSHLDEGAQDIHKTEVDIYAIAENAVQSLSPEAEAAQVTLSLNGERNTLIPGIPQQLSGIIINLCDNAIKYNRRGGRVEVSITREGDEILLTVRDTGIGIPEEHHNRIFERFYRVDKSHSKEVGGTGLGLSIVKHAARLHDATVDLASRVGEGTTVTVRFPVEEKNP
jgi:two-component system phosphate regulon sensor histidine kinase PhoR